MGTYRAPVEDMNFVINELLQSEAKLGQLPTFAEAGVGQELAAALLDEAARFAGSEVAPLRRVGDEHPARCENGAVIPSPGYAEVIQQFSAGGWKGIAADPAYGGQGLPELYGTATCEMWAAADVAFSLEPMLSIGAALAIHAHGSEELKATYLEKMHSGQWSGTMNLTEAGAGSDLGVMKARAVPEGDHYRISGQKIFITWGDHDAAENLVHLVLAKLPDAPEGSRGISLFLVPKFLVNADGSLGERNDVYPVSVEHKLGIHGSPTCVMAFGDNEGAIGYLVGQENEGLRCMFTMMNEARLKVGIQGLGAAEGAYQQAREYARERVQGGVPIIEHADVKRMLLTMKALTEAMRALAYDAALSLDLAHHGDEAARPEQQQRVDLLIPIIKGWLTEVGQELTSLGVQVHGGMGYIEETGAAQFFRDVRITSIYEGTNGIQAADLAGRKLAGDGGAGMEAELARAAEVVAQLRAQDDKALSAMGDALSEALAALQSSVSYLLQRSSEGSAAAMGGSFEFLMQCGYVLGGVQLARSALVASERLAAGESDTFYQAKIATARFYCEQVMPRAEGCARAVQTAHGALLDYSLDWI